jgi:hypothetical protein
MRLNVTILEFPVETLLHWAALKGYVDAVELLVKHGSDVHARNGNGYTPLHLVAARGAVPPSRREVYSL